MGEAEVTGAALDYRLVHGAEAGTLSTLVEHWQTADVDITLPGMAGFAAASSLGAKIRGAIGKVLLQSASAAVLREVPCDWASTCAAEVFFGKRSSIVLGDCASQIATPFVLDARAERNGALTVTVRLFGLAAAYAEVMAAAAVAALRTLVDWENLARDGAGFLPRQINPSDVVMRQAGAPDVSAMPPETFLVFRTPNDAERGDPVREPRLLLNRLIRRLALLAPWCGVSLAAAFADLQACVDRAEIELVEIVAAPVSAIGGHKHHNKVAPPGRYRVAALTEPLWTAQVLGTQTHIGRGANVGLGRYVLGG